MERLTVVITGANTLIGYLVAQEFKKFNHRVWGISNTKINRINFNYFVQDIRDTEKVKLIIRKIVSLDKKIDILINCPLTNYLGSFENHNLNVIKEMYDVDFFATLNITKEVIPYMRANNGGKIAFISSLASKFPIPFKSVYSSLKASICNFSQSLGNELARFNIKTTFFQLGDIKKQNPRLKPTNPKDNDFYKLNLEIANLKIQKYEKSGVEDLKIVNKIYKTMVKRNPPIKKIIGVKYSFFDNMSRFFSLKSVNKILKNRY